MEFKKKKLACYLSFILLCYCQKSNSDINPYQNVYGVNLAPAQKVGRMPSVYSSDGPLIKVRLAKNLPFATISGRDIDRNIYPSKDAKKFYGDKSVRFNCLLANPNLAKKEGHILLASLNSASGLLDFDVKKFSGKIHILADTEGKGCDVVNETSMEQYLSTVLSKEMNATWPIEVLKAQAVAARSYGVNKIETTNMLKVIGKNKFFDLESSEKDQVSGQVGDSTLKTLQATNDTKGEVLFDSTGKLGPIFYHAKCGGKTILPSEVWDNHVVGYKAVECPYCYNKGPRKWELHLSLLRMRSFLKWYLIKNGKSFLAENLNNKKIIIAPDKHSTNRLIIYLGQDALILTKPILRKYFGRVELPSNNFVIYPVGNNFVFLGDGLGHGVGLCQLGALELANRGLNYRQILAYYFPTHVIKKIY